MGKTNAYMDSSFVSSDLKTILHSKRANIYYLSQGKRTLLGILFKIR